jgi:hypothetical protein
MVENLATLSALLPSPRIPSHDESLIQREALNEEPSTSSHWAGERPYEPNSANIHYPFAGVRGGENVFFIPLFSAEHAGGLIRAATLRDLTPLPFTHLPQFYSGEFSGLDEIRLRAENEVRGLRNSVFLDGLELEHRWGGDDRGPSGDILVIGGLGDALNQQRVGMWVCVYHYPALYTDVAMFEIWERENRLGG